MRKKPEMEYRFYQVPAGDPCLALTGTKWYQVYGVVSGLHFHNYLEIGWCYEGAGRMWFGEEDKVDFSGGDFTVIPKNYPHTTDSKRNGFCSWAYLFIDAEKIIKKTCGKKKILGDRIQHRLEARAHLYSGDDYPYIAEKIHAIFDLMKKREEFYQEIVGGLVQSLVFDIVRLNEWDEKIGGGGYEAQIGNANKLREDWVPVVVDYVGEQFMNQIKISDLSELCHMSEVHFRRLFSKYMKMTPVEYINLVRINNACEYMLKTNDSIIDIAHKCGYPTASTFHRNFKKVTGKSARDWQMSPKNWERQLLKYKIETKEGW